MKLLIFVYGPFRNSKNTLKRTKTIYNPRQCPFLNWWSHKISTNSPLKNDKINKIQIYNNDEEADPTFLPGLWNNQQWVQGDLCAGMFLINQSTNQTIYQ